MTYLIYDIEIRKSILKKGEEPQEEIEYCEGWRDFANMGISSVATYVSDQDRYDIFMEDNCTKLYELMLNYPTVVGFNNHAFDDQLLHYHWHDFPHALKINPFYSWDLLVAVWAAVGLGPKFSYPTHAGYSLDAIAGANLGVYKSGDGASAPILYQQGRYGQLLNYNLRDVWLTKRLVDKAIRGEPFVDPKTNNLLKIDASALTS